MTADDINEDLYSKFSKSELTNKLGKEYQTLTEQLPKTVTEPGIAHSRKLSHMRSKSSVYSFVG